MGSREDGRKKEAGCAEAAPDIYGDEGGSIRIHIEQRIAAMMGYRGGRLEGDEEKLDDEYEGLWRLDIDNASNVIKRKVSPYNYDHSKISFAFNESSWVVIHMVSCNPCRTPIDTESKLGVDGDPLFSSSTTYLVAYSDADWTGCRMTQRSTSEYCVFLGNNLLSWSAKRQPTLSRSSAEAEYRGITNAVVETCWLRNLLRELHIPLSSVTLVYYDNVSAVYLSSNPVQYNRHLTISPPIIVI
ncbi:ribonuclease H-like domain-containing protein [Tanacetum coccineum]